MTTKILQKTGEIVLAVDVQENYVVRLNGWWKRVAFVQKDLSHAEATIGSEASILIGATDGSCVRLPLTTPLSTPLDVAEIPALFAGLIPEDDWATFIMSQPYERRPCRLKSARRKRPS